MSAPRECVACGRGMRSGFLYMGDFTYCGAVCFAADVGADEYERVTAEWDAAGDCDDFFWTEWEGVTT